MRALPETERGRRTRDRILRTAADLIHHRGVRATSVEQVLSASGTGKSQFYHYFENKDHLVRETLRYHTDRLIEDQAALLTGLDSWDGIRDWFDAMIDWHGKQECRGGCPIGSLAAELSERDETMRRDVELVFSLLQSYLARGLASMQARGQLRDDAEPDVLAEAALASIQGGLLLARTRRRVATLQAVLDQTLVYLRSWAAGNASHGSRRSARSNRRETNDRRVG